MESPNDYNKISDDYIKTHEKPDKKFSILPTSLKLLGDTKNKIVVDVGCGDGFFTKEFAKSAKLVYGIDNSNEQIQKAQKNPHPNIKYILADMNEYKYSNINIIFSPFVQNYLKTEEELQSLFQRFYNGLVEGGVIAGIMDMPQNTLHDAKKFGVIKRINQLKEGENISVELYNNNKHLTTLNAIYHTCETIERALKNVGFKEIKWHSPIISEEGLSFKGKDFWKRYIENCDLAYFSAKKLS